MSEIEGFDLLEEGKGHKVRCRRCGRITPPFPTARRWMERAAAVHLRDDHGDDDVRIPMPTRPPKPTPAAATS